MPETYDSLKLENQLCFPLYAAAREVTKMYKPFLDPIGLTYTQYVVMLVLWEQDGISVKELGKMLYLDSGTLTPLLKKLESNGLLNRTRSAEDERVVVVELTEKGHQLRETALQVPRQMQGCFPLDEKESLQLYQLLYKILPSGK